MRPLSGDKYSDKKLFKKIKKVASSAGVMVIYPVLILFYLFKDKNVPVASKSVIAAALAYFIFPADSIPDLTPIIGYSDDLGVLLMSISLFAKYISPEILEKTKLQLAKWFGEDVDLSKPEQQIIKRIETKLSNDA